MASPSPSPSPKFPHFSDLPAEIRLQIWALSIPERMLPITCLKGICRLFAHRYAVRFSTSHPPPALLLTNHEARSVGSSIYSAYFQTDSAPFGIQASLSHDTIMLPENTIAYIDKRELGVIERMVLEVKDYAYFGSYSMDFICAMEKLRWLELRLHDRLRYSWGSGNAKRDLLKGMWVEFNERPEWKVPEVIRIVRAVTGEELCVIRGREDPSLVGE